MAKELSKDSDEDLDYKKQLHDQYMAERTSLIIAKRETETNFVKSIIQLSSATLLLVPGFIFSNEKFNQLLCKSVLIIGIIFIGISLIAAVMEQYTSSKAYERQLEYIREYYIDGRNDREDLAATRFVKASMFTSFISFTSGIILITIWFLLNIQAFS